MLHPIAPFLNACQKSGYNKTLKTYEKEENRGLKNNLQDPIVT